jgi:hypothetical protein
MGSGEPEPGTGRPLVSGDDDGGLPAAQMAAGGATADPVKDYLKQIGQTLDLPNWLASMTFARGIAA